MRVRRWLIGVSGVICALIVLGFVATSFLNKNICKHEENPKACEELLKIDSEQLDQEIRSNNPLGSDRSAVENYLRNRGIPFSYESATNAIRASACCLKGSGIIIVGRGIYFQFNNTSKLVNIEYTQHLTGP